MPRKVKYDPNFVLTPEIRAYIDKFGYGKAAEEYGQSYQRLYYLYHKEEKSEEEAIQAGRDPSKMKDSTLWPDHIIEIEPIGTNSANIVKF